jgi:hypothetical protein
LSAIEPRSESAAPHAAYPAARCRVSKGRVSPDEVGEQLFRNLSVPARAWALPERGTVPLDIPAVMAEQARLGTEVVGPPLG